MEGWGKIGVQRASMFYPNSCYNKPCYIEVQVYQNICLSSVYIIQFVSNAKKKKKKKVKK